MEKRFAITFGVGIVVIAAAVAGILYMQRGAHVELTGRFLKVRTAPLDDNSSVAVVDFRFVNPADYPFVVRSVKLTMEDSSGAHYEGAVVSEADTRSLFAGVPLLGEKYNTTLILRDKVPAHASEDRMLAARFEVPDSRLEARKRLVIRVEDVDGPVSEITEK